MAMEEEVVVVVAAAVAASVVATIVAAKIATTEPLPAKKALVTTPVDVIILARTDMVAVGKETSIYAHVSPLSSHACEASTSFDKYSRSGRCIFAMLYPAATPKAHLLFRDRMVMVHVLRGAAGNRFMVDQ